ncbi:MAG: hypothetical protein WC939_01415 [Acholeplasmataceae bacterium]
MKKIIILITLVCGLSLMGCKKSEKPTLLVPAGSPLISVAGVLEKFDYEVTTGPSLVPSEFIKGEKDIIIAPLIIGAKLYISGSSKYQLASVIGFSNLYIISRDKLTNIKNLENKNMLAFGEHATPGIVLKTVLKDQKTNVTWGTDIKEMLAPFKTKQYDHVLISEPTLTILKSQLDEEVYTLPLKETLGQEIVQVGLFINPDSKKNLKSALKEISNNIAYLKEKPEAYALEVVDVHQQLSTFGTNVLSLSIPLMDFDYKKASSIVKKIEAFFNILNQNNQELLLNKLPDQAFYYEE